MFRLWKLAWPIMILGSARVAMRTVDIIAVGFLGSWAAASVGVGDVWLRIILFLGLGIGSGTVARVSQGLGKNNTKQADHALTQSTLLTIGIGLIATIIFWVFAEDLIRLLGAEPRIVEQGGWYLKLVGLTAVPRMLYLMVVRGMSGAEDTISPMWIGFVTTSINIIVTVLLVFGYLGLPRLGVIGAAIGTMVGNITAALSSVIVLMKSSYPLSFRWSGWFDFSEGIKVVRISIPRILNGGAEAVSRVPLSYILLWFGSEALAAFEISWRVLMLAMMPNWGISGAAATYTGQHLGAGEPDQAYQQGWLGVKLSFIIAVPLSGLLIIFRHSVAYLFIREQPTLNLAANFILVYGISMFFYCIALNLGGALEGAGHTLVPMIATVSGLSLLVGGPAVFSGYFQYGIGSIYAFIFIGFMVRGLIVVGWYEFFSWRNHPVVLKAG